MPWITMNALNQRSQFLLEVLCHAESMSAICRKYNISRQTGYKWLRRISKHGLLGLREQSRRPKTASKVISHDITTAIVSYRTSHPSWGATKIRKILLRTHQNVPSRRSIHRVLQDCNLISTRRRHFRRRKVHDRVVLKAVACNHIWTVDFKGWWRTNNGHKVYPLTIRDEFSKFVIALKLLPSPSLNLVKEAFIECFTHYGMPEYIRSDNGTPFAFSQGICGLSRLSAWWIKIGILPNFIPPASPQYNPGHERMHRDILEDLQRNPAKNLLHQQLAADAWRDDFNNIRPHDALKDRTPAEVYTRSRVRYRLSEPALEYPSRMTARFVTKQGKFQFKGKRIFLSKAVGGENIGLDFNDDNSVDIWFSTVRIATTDKDFSLPLTEYNLITDKPAVTRRVA